MIEPYPRAVRQPQTWLAVIFPITWFIRSLADGVPLSVSCDISVFPASLMVERETDQHVSSLVKKDSMCHETSQIDSWPGTHPALCIAWELCSHWDRQRNPYRPGCWDCALVPLPGLRPWPQKEPPPNLVLPEPPA